MSTYRSNVIVTLVLAVAFILHLINAQSDIYQYGEKRQDGSTARKYCGKHLSNALQLICDGIYNPMFKKSGQEMEMDDYPYAYDYPFRTRASANAMMGRFGGVRFRRQSRGVHDECCVKPCSMSELMSYCGH
ncbi:LIRP isoform X2 [Fopius arisanus]|nr:PREDICTED: LIRP-like isoform X2 [Fopius arisanus]XP_011300360.1 PREDICTED: LIRP-like isoform X2 [Fopius arisanus]